MGMLSRRAKWTGVVLGLALLASACGSTVSQSARQAAEARGGNLDATLGGDGTSGGDAFTSAAGGGSAGGTSGGSGSRSATATGAGGGTAAGGGAVSTAVGPGVTDKEIHVGVPYAVNGGAANAAIGASGIDQGDEKRNTQVVVDDINKNGGVAGRKLVPEYYELDATSADTIDNQYQAACESLTQDRKIFVLMGGDNENFLRCLNNAKVIALNENLTISDGARFKRYPYYFEITALNVDRIAANEIPALQAQNYFTGWNTATGTPGPAKPKVGILTFDMPGFNHAVDQVMVPALAKIGLKPDSADVIRAPDAQRVSDVSADAAVVSNAVLKFRSDGVTHVLVLEKGGTLSLLFGNQAESQGYRPRYGANTQTGQQALLDSGAYPKSQLNGTVGIGWSPSIDITPAENPDNGPYSNDSRRRCLALYKAAGVTYDNANAAAVSLGTCNQFWFFRDVMKNAVAVNRDAFLAAANKMGTSFQSTGGMVTRIDPNHHDGMGAIYYWQYKPECSCMRYTSGLMQID